MATCINKSVGQSVHKFASLSPKQSYLTETYDKIAEQKDNWIHIHEQFDCNWTENQDTGLNSQFGNSSGLPQKALDLLYI